MTDNGRTLPEAPDRLRQTLLDWYDRHGRDLPWRSPSGRQPDPYHVWLSEIMLQQTTVAAVRSYFDTFLARWPTVHDLAAAPAGDVMAAWAGLGYYARARNLLACAKAVSEAHGGRFPDSEDALRVLPGIGAYTSAAIAAIAFDRPATVVDGNVERVIARLVDLETPMPRAKPDITRLTAMLVATDRPGDFAQATMDLGATICTARAPACALCPWRQPCRARLAGTVAQRPVKAIKKARPLRYGVAFWLVRGREVLLVRRPDRGLLGGMLGLPGTDWREQPWPRADALQSAPISADWQLIRGNVRHVFTHFALDLAVWTAVARDDPVLKDGDWVPLTQVLDAGLPTVMLKAAKLALTSSNR